MNDIRKQIVESARQWLGVRFKHQGRSKKGVDCVGLVLKVHNDVFDSDEKVGAYSKRPDQKDVHRLLKHYLQKIDHTEAKDGDVALMAFDTGATHIGILAGDSVIHSTIMFKKVIEQPIDKNLQIVGWYRFKGVDTWQA